MSRLFPRLRLIGHAGTATPARPGAGRPAARTADGGEAKTLIAAALAQPPVWTNRLPVADPSGRAANCAAVLPPLPAAASSAAKGGVAWPRSVAPHSPSRP